AANERGNIGRKEWICNRALRNLRGVSVSQVEHAALLKALRRLAVGRVRELFPEVGVQRSLLELRALCERPDDEWPEHGCAVVGRDDDSEPDSHMCAEAPGQINLGC